MPTATTETPPPALTDSPPANQHKGAGFALWRVVTRFELAKLTPYQALRNSFGVVLPLIAGYAIGIPSGGLIVATGALIVAYSDGDDPYLQRAKRLLAASAICALAVLAGGISARHLVIALVMATSWAFIAGMVVSLGTAAADLGVISLMTLVIFAAQPLTPKLALISSALALGGGLLQTALSVALWPVRRYEPERRALGNFYLALARSAEKPPSVTSAPPASQESTQAQDELSGLGRDITLEGVRYRALLNQAERLRLGLLVLSRLRIRMARENRAHAGVEIIEGYLQKTGEVLEAIGNSLLTAKPPGSQRERLVAIDALTLKLRALAAELPSSFFEAVLRDALFQMDALYGQLRGALRLSRSATIEGQEEFARQEAQQPWQLRFSGLLATLRANLTMDSSTFRHAVRLAALVAIGELLGHGIYWRRSYWITMTIVLVLKPDFTSTFSRGLLRIGGTFAGLLIATALFYFFPSSVAMLIVSIFVFTFLLRWVGPANYGIFAVAVTALVVLLLAITGVSPSEVIVPRGLNTAVGGALALIAYWIWPTWERKGIPERIAQALDGYREYFQELLKAYRGMPPGTAADLDRMRSKARLGRSNLEAAIDRLAAEPGTTAEQMNHLNAKLAALHRFIHALLALDAGLLQTPAVKPRAEFLVFAADLEKTLQMLAARLRGQRVASRDFPDLREDHTRLVQAGNEAVERYALVNVEADRITNSVNTLREQILVWTREQRASYR